MEYTVLSKELLSLWFDCDVTPLIRQRYIQSLGLSIFSAKTDNKLTFMSDCAYVWTKGGKCTTMKWEELDKLQGEFSHLSARYFKKWFIEKVTLKNNINENRLQKQETHVVRGDDGEGSGIQGRRGQTAITVGHLSYKAVQG